VFVAGCWTLWRQPEEATSPAISFAQVVPDAGMR
jgi:hypothetical protein